jgi:hypothetical protein
MHTGAAPFVSRENALPLFDLFEDRAYGVVMKYLEGHGWHDEARRLKESRFVGVGTYRLLTTLSEEYLDGSPEELVSFYERCKRPKDDPHYEDLITTVLLGVVLGVISNYCYDAVKNRVPNLHEPKKLARRLWERFGPSLEYLFRARFLREKLWRREIQKETHDLALYNLRVRYLSSESQKAGDEEPEILVEMEVEFESMAEGHGLDLKELRESLMLALIELSPGPEELAEELEQFRRLLEGKEAARADRQDRRALHGMDKADDRQAPHPPESPRRVQRRARPARKRDSK